MQSEVPMDARQTSAFLTARLSEAGGRPANEDFCGYLQVETAACWVVADGLGGHRGGGAASRTATEVFLTSFRDNPEISSKALETHIAGAHAAILKLQRQDPSASDMRTTIVALISDSRRALWAHVGDSRLYRFQARGLIAQTQDHSVPQCLVNAGDITSDEIRGNRDRNRLLRSLGEPGPARPTVLPSPVPLCDSDAFLLCTDGFWEHVWEMELLADLAASETPDEWLNRAACRLRRRVRGEYDNYSALAIFYVPEHTQRVASVNAAGAGVQPPANDRTGQHD